MAARTEEVLGAGAGLVATLAIGVTALVPGMAVGADPMTVALWWTAYVVYLAVFALDSGVLPVGAPWSSRAVVAGMFVAGMAVWLLAPHLGFTPLLFVVTTAAAAYVLTGPALVLLVAAQTIAIAVGGASVPWDSTSMVFTPVAYLAFQAFAALVVTGTRRQAEARAALAVANADLEAATALLATSSRIAERLRIARDLHDLLGHQLTALALELEVAAHRTAGDGLEHVHRARAIAKDLLTDVRATVGELRDVPAGLEPTLREVVGHVPGLDVELTVDERVPLDEARRIGVIRCVQEVVTNTVRHASATHLRIDLASDTSGLVLRAQDDGVGARRVEPGNGLTGMRERMEELGGALTVESAPGQGFTVTARVPG
jgi:signal transduction histidine kinase